MMVGMILVVVLLVKLKDRIIDFLNKNFAFLQALRHNFVQYRVKCKIVVTFLQIVSQYWAAACDQPAVAGPAHKGREKVRGREPQLRLARGRDVRHQTGLPMEALGHGERANPRCDWHRRILRRQPRSAQDRVCVRGARARRGGAADTKRDAITGARRRAANRRRRVEVRPRQPRMRPTPRRPNLCPRKGFRRSRATSPK